MIEYPKIKTLFKRDPKTHKVTTQFSTPEFEYLKNNQWEIREKIDGTNIRVYWDGKTVRFSGRTDRAQIPVFLLDKLQDMFPLEKFDEEICLYGEGYGAKIQKEEHYDSMGFRLFDVYCGGWWLEDVSTVAQEFDIATVPLISFDTPENIISHVEAGFNSMIGTGNAEGVVMRPMSQLFDQRGYRIIAKLKTKDF